MSNITKKLENDKCPDNFACLPRINPANGTIHFDDIISSSVLMFEMFTLDGWSDIMYLVRRANQSNIYDIFFLIVVWVGAFFVVNLVCAIQFQYYDVMKRQKENEDRIAIAQKKRGMYKAKEKVKSPFARCHEYM